MQIGIDYIKNFWKDKQVASIMPSSKFSVRYLKNKIDFDDADIILEYGAGNGVFSEMLARNMKPDSTLVLFETNKEFADILNEKFKDDDRVKISQSSALEAKKVLKELNLDKVNYIITGIPFTFLDDEKRTDLIRSSYGMLKKGGRFISYQFSLTVNKYVKDEFGDLKLSVQPLNIPPLLVVEGKK